MDRKIENLKWKEQRIKTYRKRSTFFICLLSVVPFIFCCFAYIFDDYSLLIVGGGLTVAYAIINYHMAKRLQGLAQMTMVYKFAEESFQSEWNDFVTSVDFSMNKEYEKNHKKHSKE